MNAKTLPVAIIGGGPVGLAAVAHLLERGETPILFEAGDAIAANIRHWGHVRLFSPWEFTVDGASVRLLESHGWQMLPENDLPTGNDLRENYLLPFADLPEVRDAIHLNARVVAISRSNVDKMKDNGRDDAPFILHIEYADGRENLIEARAVIDASGTWHNPNPIGANGLPAIGEKRHADRIFYGMPDVFGQDKARYANKRVMVVGSGHSAINALLDIAKLQQDYPQTQAFWVMRSANLQRVYGGQDDDALPARGQLGSRIKAQVNSGAIRIVAPFRIGQMSLQSGNLEVVGDTPDGQETLIVDEVIATTGSRPDLEMLRELRLELDPALESTRELGPMIDPNIHSCGTVRPHGEAELRHPEKDFYIVGMKSYGRAPTFLLATGYEQVRSVVAGLVGDWESARDVQLNLPETGVCSTDLGGEGGACCSPSASIQSAPAFLSVSNIAVKASPLQLIQVSSNVDTSCGCGDDCCGDGVRSTTCGCDDTCCS